MKPEYQNWIDKYPGDIFRRCAEVTIEMQAAFPELRIAKGMAQIIENRQWYPHQWLVDGTDIVDPTAKQWIKIAAYKEIGDDDPKPTGKCANCGEWIYGKVATVCSDKCWKEYRDYLMNPD